MLKKCKGSLIATKRIFCKDHAANYGPPCFLGGKIKWRAFSGRLSLAGEVESMSFNDFFVVKENSSGCPFWLSICIELVETFWFQISQLYFPSFQEGFLSFCDKRPSMTFLSCLFWDCRVGWLNLLISFQYEKRFWTCLTHKPRRALLPLTSSVDCQDRSCCTLHRELHKKGAVSGCHNYVFFAKQ